MGDHGGRAGKTRSVAELLVGSLLVLLARGRRMPRTMGWRPGAVEIQLPFATGRYRLRADPTALVHSKQSTGRIMRPLLLAGFLFAFAGIGVGFGGLDVAAPTAFAPGTPGPQVTVIQIEPEAPGQRSGDGAAPVETTAESRIVVAPLEPAEPEPTATATSTAEPSPTATEDPPTATPTSEPPPAPTPTAAPAVATPEPEPEWDYYPVSQLAEPDFRVMAAQAGWPAELHDNLVAVARCESSLRPNARTAWAYGIMQLVPTWFDYAGAEFDSWTDPVVNLQAAYAVYLYDINRGNAPWAQWVCKPPAVTPTPAATATSTVLAAATDESTDQ